MALLSGFPLWPQMQQGDRERQIQQAVQTAAGKQSPLNIIAGGSKSFYGRTAQGQALDVSGHQGIINYHPSELVITARAGTRLADIQQTLAEQGQILAFEPPSFAASATLGGTVACGISGCRRPFAGAARDFVLGCKIINGQGEVLSFGGEVMKNVAGYDVSRLMAGAMGTLGVLLEISLKVLPIPHQEMTCTFQLGKTDAMHKMLALALQSLPLSALSYDGERVYVRLSGVESAVQAAVKKTGPDVLLDGQQYWHDLKEQQLDFFQSDKPLWRISVAPATPELQLAGDWFVDWGGALRWLKTDETAENIFAGAANANGHATLFRSGDRSGEVFQPLTGKFQQLNHNLKKAFDPQGILNPGKIFTDD